MSYGDDSNEKDMNPPFDRLRQEANTIRPHSITIAILYNSQHIRLRPLTESDWDLLIRWNSDPDVVYYSEGSIDDLHSPDEIKEIYRMVSQKAYCFLIECDGFAIGECWLQEMNIDQITDEHPGLDCRRIDIMIGEKEFWHRGIGAAVIRSLTSFGFGQLKVDLIFGLVSDYNERSIRAFQKAGFTKKGMRKEPEGSKGMYEIQMCISKQEYLAMQ